MGHTVAFLVILGLFVGVLSLPKVLINDPSVPKLVYEILGDKYDLVTLKNVTKEDFLENVKGVEGIFLGNHFHIDADILDAAGPQLKAIVTMSAGYDNIDVSELKKRGIKLGNLKGVLSNSVAETAILLALAAGRRLHEGRLKIEKGEWKANNDFLLGYDLHGSTVGIVGLGSIGYQIAKRLKAFDVKEILYTGHREKPEGTTLGAKFVHLDQLNRESDFIFLSAALNNETRGLIDEHFFQNTKKTAVLINVSRGAVVDQEALIKALKDGRLFAAGLDVMTPEPLPTDHELLKLPNVVLMPHIGSATYKTRNAMAEASARDLIRGLEGKPMLIPVV